MFFLRRYVLSVVFILFSVHGLQVDASTDAVVVGQLGTSFTKLATMVLADYFYFEGKENKALIFDILWHISSSLNVCLKSYSALDQTSLLEYGFVLHDFISITDNVFELLYYHEKELKKKRQKNKEQSEDRYSVLYSLCKYLGVIIDFYSSLGFAYTDENMKKLFLSRFSACAKLFSRCFDNRIPQISSKFGVLVSLFAFVVVTAKANVDEGGSVQEVVFEEREIDLRLGVEEEEEFRWEDFVDFSEYEQVGQEERVEGIIDNLRSARLNQLDSELASIEKNISFSDLQEKVKPEDVKKCSVCDDFLVDRGNVSVIGGCHHIYCTDCMNKWCKRRIRIHLDPNCPYCRNTIHYIKDFRLI